MRVQVNGSSVTLWASADDTRRWATRPYASWPCSTLRGKRFVASFDRNGLYDLSVNGRSGADIDAHEFNACTSDLLALKLPESHPCHFVAVGQFLSSPAREES